MVPVETAHSASTTSSWVYAHLAQLVASDRYGMMDFGPTENMRRYGSEEAPLYPLANITSPDIALFRGLNDALADNADVERLVRELRGFFVPFLLIFSLTSNASICNNHQLPCWTTTLFPTPSGIILTFSLPPRKGSMSTHVFFVS